MSDASRSSGPSIVLEFVVLVCGAVVMAYEIIGSRIVAPYIGTSTYVWTSLIGVILASLSLGYWLGGKTADERPDVKVLASAIFVAGGLVSLTILIRDLVLSFISSAPAILELKAVLASLILFAPASVALGFVIPYATKLRIATLDDAGKTVGRLYALSTIGSIVGTFAAGFLLIPFVGSTRSLYIIAGSLFLLSLLLATFAFNRIAMISLLLFAAGVVGSELTSAYLKKAFDLQEFDTEYSHVRVFTSKQPKTERPMRVLSTDPYSIQSAIYFDTDDLALTYTRYYHLVRHYRPGHRNTLMIGGAGYSFPKEHLRVYPEAKIAVVEIDPGMTQIARRYFNLVDHPMLSIIHEDGRTFLNRARSSTFEVVMVDAFGSLFSIPYHLTTVEAVREIHRILDDDGVVIMNLGSALSGDAAMFFQAELATYRSVFASVDVYRVDAGAADSSLQNLMLVGRKRIETAGVVLDDPVLEELLAGRYEPGPPNSSLVLTDDLAPIEYFSSVAHALASDASTR
ncbi:MAG TPA: fused MFS/spermidine synthase [Pyrinomonadaceae bacterium]|nr:fused MFS/spermidine synthase [Chloracidobacterium sp.]HBE84116.1 spermidine synthase [Blastocatellia bacterium]HRJ88605.1 fused MFS/spermidine synthase [Pyrinomonadaceae bacterium]HRK49472.1 fused MFS/spermidine synthase [Pyrinomonadaceae bacterium]